MTDTQTGVGFTLSSAHKDAKTGALHGHSYDVVCWFSVCEDAVRLRRACIAHCSDLDHAVLPDELSWGEALAAEIKRRTGASEVVVSRPLERIYARAK